MYINGTSSLTPFVIYVLGQVLPTVVSPNASLASLVSDQTSSTAGQEVCIRVQPRDDYGNACEGVSPDRVAVVLQGPTEIMLQVR